MVGHGVVLVDLVELVVDEVGVGVLLAVHGAQLDGGEDLGHGHGGSGAAHGLKGGAENLGLGDTNLQTLQVLGLRDGALGVGDVAEAVVPPGKDLEALLLALLLQSLAGVAVQDAEGLLGVVKQEGQVQGVDLGDEVGQGHGGLHSDVQGAHLHKLDGLGAGSNLGSGEHVDGDVAAGLLRHQLGKLFSADLVGVSGSAHVVQGQGGFGGHAAAGSGGGVALAAAAADQTAGHNQGEDTCQDTDEALFHGFPPCFGAHGALFDYFVRRRSACNEDG